MTSEFQSRPLRFLLYSFNHSKYGLMCTVNTVVEVGTRFLRFISCVMIPLSLLLLRKNEAGKYTFAAKGSCCLQFVFILQKVKKERTFCQKIKGWFKGQPTVHRSIDHPLSKCWLNESDCEAFRAVATAPGLLFPSPDPPLLNITNTQWLTMYTSFFLHRHALNGSV